MQMLGALGPLPDFRSGPGIPWTDRDPGHLALHREARDARRRRHRKLRRVRRARGQNPRTGRR